MKTTGTQPTDTTAKLTIEVGPDELAAAEQVALTKLSTSVKVPGFRKGKVPVAVAAKHVDSQSLQQQLLDDAISKAVAEAFVAEKVQALDRPQVEVTKYVPGEILEFTAESAILPEITLGDYKKLGVTAKKVTIAKAAVNESIDKMRQGFAEKIEVTRKAKDGDETVIDFVGKKDGVAFDGGTGTDYILVLGSHQFIPGFEEGIIGHKTGESFDLELDFPDNYHAKDLAGQKVTFTTTLKKVTENKLPELNDDFAVKAGFKTMAEVEADVKRELTAQEEQAAAETHKDALIDAAIAVSTIPLPEILVTDQMRSIEQDFKQNLMYRGLDVESYLTTNGYQDEDAWRVAEVRPAAERRTKAGLVLSEISKTEKLTVTEDEIDRQVEAYKKQYANSPETVASLDKPEVRQDVANRLVTEKTIDRLVELNK